jgi:hypothetical protein
VQLGLSETKTPNARIIPCAIVFSKNISAHQPATLSNFAKLLRVADVAAALQYHLEIGGNMQSEQLPSILGMLREY